MAELKPWYALDINVQNAIRADFDIQQRLKQREKNAKYDIWYFEKDSLIDFYSVEWLEYMRDLDLEVNATLVFYREANYQHPHIHTDAPGGPQGKLGLSFNWCITPDTSYMVWYDTRGIAGVESQTEVGTRFYYWPSEIGVEIHRRQIGSVPTLVRVDIPHSVIMGPTSRLCVSCRVDFKPENWEHAVAKCKKFIKE